MLLRGVVACGGLWGLNSRLVVYFDGLPLPLNNQEIDVVGVCHSYWLRRTLHGEQVFHKCLG